MDCAFRAVFDTVHAKVTFRNSKGCVRVASAVTVAEAFFAVVAKVNVAPYSKKRPERKQPQKGTQRTDRAAPEPGKKSVGKDDRQEDKTQQGSAIKKGLFQIKPTPAVINRRKYRDCE